MKPIFIKEVKNTGRKERELFFAIRFVLSLSIQSVYHKLGSMNVMDFGQQNSSCHIISEGFVLWEVTGEENGTPVFLEGTGTDMIVHVLMLEGGMKMGWGGRLYPLTKGCFANFIDNHSLEVRDLSRDARAYVMLSTIPFITSLLKNTPPFPPSYVLKIKVWPVFVLPSETVQLFLKRIENIVEILKDNAHHFQTEMLKCALWIFMMDIANEHIRQESESGKFAETGRKNILFKQFIRLLLTHIREEHSVGWYALQLCVTPQYLNRAVKSASQRTAYDHICTTLIGAIIEQLENTEDSVSQIADDFHFVDLATMTKFFKRQTGKTPTEYRKAVTLL